MGSRYIPPAHLYKTSNDLHAHISTHAKRSEHRDAPYGASGTSSASGAAATSKPQAALAITGGQGSLVTTDDGSTFTYNNTFGGVWYYDPNDPFNNGARAQSWSPALNETFDWSNDPIWGCVSRCASMPRSC